VHVVVVTRDLIGAVCRTELDVVVEQIPSI
jgi:hypothetical protein